MTTRSTSANLLSSLLLFVLLHTARATPISAALSKRDPVIAYDGSGRIDNVTDIATGIPITQGAATDGSGLDFNVPAILWLVYAFAVGVPLMLAGVRLWRATTGAGVGIAATVCGE